MSAAVGPRPREGVVVQHSGHDEVDLVGAHVRLALGVVVVRKVESGTETVGHQQAGVRQGPAAPLREGRGASGHHS